MATKPHEVSTLSPVDHVELTHWPLRDVAIISKVLSMNSCCGLRSWALALRWMPLNLFDDEKSTLVQVMAWCHQAASHFSSQWHYVDPDLCHDMASLGHGPLTRYVKLQVAHAPGMPGTFSPAADFKGNRWLAIPTCITARAWRTCRDACRDRLPAVTGKTFPAFPAHAHPLICVSGKWPMMSWLSPVF